MELKRPISYEEQLNRLIEHGIKRNPLKESQRILPPTDPEQFTSEVNCSD